MWRQCYDGRGWAFLCPNGTIFSQELLTCVWWFDFDCGQAEQLYSANSELYAVADTGGEDAGNAGELPVAGVTAGAGYSPGARVEEEEEEKEEPGPAGLELVLPPLEEEDLTSYSLPAYRSVRRTRRRRGRRPGRQL